MGHAMMDGRETEGTWRFRPSAPPTETQRPGTLTSTDLGGRRRPQTDPGNGGSLIKVSGAGVSACCRASPPPPCCRWGWGHRGCV